MRNLECLFSSASTEWGTPADLFGALHATFRFTTDVCACHYNAKLPRYIEPPAEVIEAYMAIQQVVQPSGAVRTQDMRRAKQALMAAQRKALASADWTRDRGPVWMNPPYGDEIPLWVAKAVVTARQGTTVVGLLPARTDTGWWLQSVLAARDIWFIQGRLRFVLPSGKVLSSAPFPSAVAVWRPDDDPHFASIGWMDTRGRVLHRVAADSEGAGKLYTAPDRLNVACCEALRLWGAQSQVAMVIEECAELIQAVTHWQRGRATAAQVLSEIADVRIVSEQARLIVGASDDQVAQHVLAKLIRLESRLEAHQERLRQQAATEAGNGSAGA